MHKSFLSAGSPFGPFCPFFTKQLDFLKPDHITLFSWFKNPTLHLDTSQTYFHSPSPMWPGPDDLFRAPFSEHYNYRPQNSPGPFRHERLCKRSAHKVWSHLFMSVALSPSHLTGTTAWARTSPICALFISFLPILPVYPKQMVSLVRRGACDIILEPSIVPDTKEARCLNEGMPSV
jgi:hypothetical protein